MLLSASIIAEFPLGVLAPKFITDIDQIGSYVSIQVVRIYSALGYDIISLENMLNSVTDSESPLKDDNYLIYHVIKRFSEILDKWQVQAVASVLIPVIPYVYPTIIVPDVTISTVGLYMTTNLANDVKSIYGDEYTVTSQLTSLCTAFENFLSIVYATAI